MSFTQAQIQSVNNSNVGGAPAQKFDPNATTMQTLPSATAPEPSYLSRVGSDISSAVKSGAESETASATGQENPILAGLDIAKNVTGAVASPITEALKPVMDKTGLTNLFNYIGQASQGNGSPIDAITTALSKHPDITQGLSDAVDTFMNMLQLEGTIEGGQKLVDTSGKILDTISQPTEQIPSVDETLKSRTADATPAYNKNMIGTNVKTPDTIDAQGNPVEGKITPRIASEGKGNFGERPVTTSASEAESGKELANIKDYPDKGTALEKSLAVGKEISNEAENMRSGLQEEDKTNPLDAEAEKTKMADLVKSNLPEDIKAKLGYISPEDEASLQPAAKAYREALASKEDEVGMPKTAAGRYYQQVLDALKEYNGTREGKLDLRQAIDSAYKNARGKLAFGSDSQNVLDEVNTDIRNSINKDLADTTENTDTQASLKKQTNLYRASDVLNSKARVESDTAFGRLEQKYPTLQRSLRMIQRQGIMIPIRLAEAGVGIYAIQKWLSSNK